MSAETFKAVAAVWIATGKIDRFIPRADPVPSLGLNPLTLLIWEKDREKTLPSKV